MKKTRQHEGSQAVQSNSDTVINAFTDSSFLSKSLALGLTNKNAFRPNPAVSYHNGIYPGKGKHAVFFKKKFFKHDSVHLCG